MYEKFFEDRRGRTRQIQPTCYRRTHICVDTFYLKGVAADQNEICNKENQAELRRNSYPAPAVSYQLLRTMDDHNQNTCGQERYERVFRYKT